MILFIELFVSVILGLDEINLKNLRLFYVDRLKPLILDSKTC